MKQPLRCWPTGGGFEHVVATNSSGIALRRCGAGVGCLVPSGGLCRWCGRPCNKRGLGRGILLLVAATHGPGLIGGLLIGLTAAKGLALAWDCPFVGVNHIEGHISANFIAHPEIEPPFICLTVSGGHTDLLYGEAFGKYRLLGRTRDDAAGEAFDKVARAMGLGYPGGPVIDQLAPTGQANIPLVRSDALAGTYDFSFSGLKTAVINLLHRAQQQGGGEPPGFAASFQRAVWTNWSDLPGRRGVP